MFLGSYIKLKDKKWALAAEDFITPGTLISFCVDNQQDARLLSKILQKVCGKSQKPTIITSKFITKVIHIDLFLIQVKKKLQNFDVLSQINFQCKWTLVFL